MPSINSKELISLLAEKGVQLKLHLHRPSEELTNLNQTLEFMSRVVNSNFTGLETLKSVMSYVIRKLGTKAEVEIRSRTETVDNSELMYLIGRFIVEGQTRKRIRKAK